MKTRSRVDDQTILDNQAGFIHRCSLHDFFDNDARASSSNESGQSEAGNRLIINLNRGYDQSSNYWNPYIYSSFNFFII